MIQRLTVASYNVHEWIGVDGREDTCRTLRVIRDLHADIIALQEVSIQTMGKVDDSLREFAGAIGMQVIRGPTFYKRNAEYGNVLLSAHPPLFFQKLDLGVGGREPRGAIIAGFGSQESRFIVIATHLGLSGRERFRQLKRLSEVIEMCGEFDLILAGDLNEWNPINRLFMSFYPLFKKMPALRTYPSRMPLLALDRIMVWPHAALKEIAVVKSPLARVASDHLPLIAKVDWSVNMS